MKNLSKKYKEEKNKLILNENAIIIYVTAKNLEEAEKISLHLLKKKLIACSNVFPIKSFYFWNNQIQKDEESVILLKTIKKRYKKIEQEIKKIHSYDVPAIYYWELKDINKDYLRWMLNYIK